VPGRRTSLQAFRLLVQRVSTGCTCYTRTTWRPMSACVSICQTLKNAPAPWAGGRRSRRLALPTSEFYIFSKYRGTAADAVNSATVLQLCKSQHYNGCICICSRALTLQRSRRSPRRRGFVDGRIFGGIGIAI
jgi:hypothetical protein